jgi:1,4-alpha-glucan branching enzyme
MLISEITRRSEMTAKKQKTTRKKVIFSMHAPQAESVMLAGDFNQWNPWKHPLKKSSSGAWEASLLLIPDTYEYKYLVDGDWQIDPVNKRTCENCFGSQNSLVTVSK